MVDLAPGSSVDVENPHIDIETSAPGFINDILLKEGPTGPTGPANTLTIGTVTTGAAGSLAEAAITGVAPNQTLSLTIPRGNTGAQGIPGVKGDTGSAGPANSLGIGTVTTGAAGSSASASITGTAPSQTLSLTIPRGDKGDKGNTGDPGPAGTVTYGTTAGTAAQGNDSRITGAAQKSENLSDLANAATGRTNLGAAANILGGDEISVAFSALTGTVPIDAAAGSIFYNAADLTNNITLALSNISQAGRGRLITVYVKHNASLRTVAFSGATLEWQTAIPTGTASKRTTYHFQGLGDGSTVLAWGSVAS